MNPENIQRRMKGVPESKRSHMYNAITILEFLEESFMPLKYFLPPTFKPAPLLPLGEKSMKKISEGKTLSIGQLYDLYRLWREEKPYTSAVETRYIFGIIIKNLRLYRNGWEFAYFRVGTAQIWNVGPLVMRNTVPVEDQRKWKPEVPGAEAASVEADPITPPEEEELPKIEINPERFKEATFEVDVSVEPAPPVPPEEF